MAKGKGRKRQRPAARDDAPGVGLEKVVARIQQMMDRNSTVTHNEWLVDRIGLRRQYDVVVRGQFAGQPHYQPSD
jgi:hypothetical protein